MQFVRKALVFIVASVFTPFLFLTVTTTALVTIVTPLHIKTWLKTSNVYTNFDNAVLQSIANSTQDNGNTGDLLSQPAAQAAAKTAFTPELLQRSTETLIDGMFSWLEGKTATPTFRIDLSSTKQDFARGIGNYALSRYNSLPVCAKNQLPNTSDILSINCRMASYDITSAIDKEVQSISNSKDFLVDPVITGDSLKIHDNNGQAVSLAQKYSKIPQYYRWLALSPYVFGSLSLLGGLIIIFASLKRRSGLRRVAVSLISTSAFLFVGAWLVNTSLNKIRLVVNQNNAVGNLAQSTALSVVHNVGQLYEKINIYFGVGFVVVGLGIIIVLIATRKHAPHPPSPVEEKEQPVKQNDDDNKPQQLPPAPPPPKPRPRPRQLIQ